MGTEREALVFNNSVSESETQTDGTLPNLREGCMRAGGVEETDGGMCGYQEIPRSPHEHSSAFSREFARPSTKKRRRSPSRPGKLQISLDALSAHHQRHRVAVLTRDHPAVALRHSPAATSAAWQRRGGWLLQQPARRQL